MQIPRRTAARADFVVINKVGGGGGGLLKGSLRYLTCLPARDSGSGERKKRGLESMFLNNLYQVVGHLYACLL